MTLMSHSALRAGGAVSVVLLLPLLALVSTPPASSVAPNINGRLVVSADYALTMHDDVFTMDPDGANRTNLTAENFTDIANSPAPSPDGSLIAYTAQGGASDQDQVFVMNADGSGKTMLTDSENTNSSPTWSPDGSKIAFTRAGDIWTMAPDGSDEQVLADEGSWALGSPEYSPGGESIAFTRSDQAAGSRIMTMPATGGVKTARTAFNDKVKGPSWSPDGSRILFWHDSGNLEGLYTMTPTGGDLTRIFAGSVTDLADYTWSPQGDRIALISRTTGESEVWLLDPDGTDPVQITQADGKRHNAIAWSADITVPTRLDDLVVGITMAPVELPFAGGSATFNLDGGVLPEGITMSPSGTLSGTPTTWGTSIFQVRATDGVTTERTKYSLRVLDSDDPIVAINSPWPATAHSSSVTTSLKHPVQWTGVDETTGIANYDVRYRRVQWNSGEFTSWVYPSAWQETTKRKANHGLAKGYTYCYTARATDDSGRTGPWSPQRCTIAPLDDMSLSASAGWVRKTSTAYFKGSALMAKSSGKTLTRTNVRAARLGILASTCPTCGKVEVSIGNTVLGRINLARGTRLLHRKVLLLPKFTAPVSGTVKIRTLNKLPARIDGLVVGAR